MISLGDLLSGDTMAGEAGAEAPKILLGADAIANAYLQRESAQNKLRAEDLKLAQEMKNAPLNDVLLKAKALQELNIGDPEPTGDDWLEAIKQIKGDIGDGKDISLTPEELEKVKLAVGPIAKARAPKPDLNNLADYIQKRTPDIIPQYQVEKEKYQQQLENRLKIEEQKTDRRIQEMMAKMGFDLKLLGARQDFAAGEGAKTRQQQQALQDQRLQEQRQREEKKAREKLEQEQREKYAEFMQEVSNIKANFVLNQPQKIQQIQRLFMKYRNLIPPGSVLPEEIDGYKPSQKQETSKPAPSGGARVTIPESTKGRMTILSQKETYIKWARENANKKLPPEQAAIRDKILKAYGE